MNDRVTDLAGAATRPMVELSIDHDAETDTASDRDNQEIVDPAPGSEPLFGKGKRIDIVIDINRHLDFVLQQLAQGSVR